MKHVALLEICLPDYFTGYSGSGNVLSIPVHGTMTNNEIAAQIEDEFNAYYEEFNQTNSPEIDALWDEYISGLRAKGEEIFCDLPAADEDNVNMEDTAYAYFAVINPVTR